MRKITSPGLLAWRVSGVATGFVIVMLTTVGVFEIQKPGSGTVPLNQQAVPARTVVVSGQRLSGLSGLSVESYGAPIKITGGPGRQVTVTEAISFAGPEPSVTQTMSHGQLGFSAPECATAGCSVGFTVTVPYGLPVSAIGDGGQVTVANTGGAILNSGGGPVYAANVNGALKITADGGDVTVNRTTASADIDSGGGSVTAARIAGNINVLAEGGQVTVNGAGPAQVDSGGGPVSVSGITGPLTVSAQGGSVDVTAIQLANIDSGGGSVTASGVQGALTLQTAGGPVQVNNLTGALSADTGGGPLSATGIASRTMTVRTEGSDASLEFSSPPQSVQVDTGGGPAELSLPGGPYAASLDSGGGNESVSIATDPGAARLISVTTEGGDIEIGP
jgi:hypothetical protein